jgi:lycopene elongase/hydratase (dihydrobisanhydrobacterioruberin-forming)
VSPGRALGYRLLGGGFDYVLHLRPAEWPIMAAHTAVGYLLATGLAGATGPWLAPGLLGIALWVVCLNGGTLALNSAYDRDEGDVAYLRNPPPPPGRLAAASLGIMATGQLVAAAALPLRYTLAYAFCFLLSVLYSVPPVRLKSVAGADWVINMLGFGTLTPYAGWTATGLPFDGARWLVLLAFCPLFAALYPLTQLYQLEEDTRRGDRTLAVVLGVRRSLDVALGATLAAFAMFAIAAILSGWTEGPNLLRWPALLVALGAWLRVLIPWRVGHARWQPADHQRGMYRALVAWAITDLAVLVLWAT